MKIILSPDSFKGSISASEAQSKSGGSPSCVYCLVLYLDEGMLLHKLLVEHLALWRNLKLGIQHGYCHYFGCWRCCDNLLNLDFDRYFDLDGNLLDDFTLELLRGWGSTGC